MIALFFLSPAASATDVLIEPYLGYHWSKFSFGNSTPDATGLTFGGRFGGDFQDFQFGLDYMTGSWKDDQNPSDSITPGNFGVFVGYKFPEMTRFYATYFFNEQYKFSNGGSTTYDGTEFRFGVGITTLPVININFEYGSGTIANANGHSISAALVSYFGLVISAPFEF